MSRAPANTAGALALLALFLPLAVSGLFLVSLALLFASFVLAIVSLVKGRIAGGVIVLVILPIAFFGSCTIAMNRKEIMQESHHRPTGR